MLLTRGSLKERTSPASIVAILRIPLSELTHLGREHVRWVAMECKAPLLKHSPERRSKGGGDVAFESGVVAVLGRGTRWFSRTVHTPRK